MLSRLKPKKIVVVSSCPQIRYPDCYGIDMSKMGDFIAFNAAVSLARKNGLVREMEALFDRCRSLEATNALHTVNVVKEFYGHFSTEALTQEIAALITPPDVSIPVEVIFQNIENLHKSCPNNRGDWYFTGNYPTSGGNRVVNRAFMNYMEGRNERGY
jgi:amidophosphoribosyltransferase